MPLITGITLPQWFRLMSKMLPTDFGIPHLLYVRSHEITHTGRIKQCKSKAILSDLRRFALNSTLFGVGLSSSSS